MHMNWRKHNPEWVNKWINKQAMNPEDYAFEIGVRLSVKQHPNPELSVVIPAYNEEANILFTLDSLSRQKALSSYEVIVVNNNSSDRTAELASKAGAIVVHQPQPGIPQARQKGLESANGSLILSGDADSFYGPLWARSMSNALEKNLQATCIIANYRFVAHSISTRFFLDFINGLSDGIRWIKGWKRPYLNAMGFNMAFRKADGMDFGGYNQEVVRGSDGYLAMELAKEGKLYTLQLPKSASVYTWPRRLYKDGGLFRALIMRIRKELQYLPQHIGLSRTKTPSLHELKSK